MVLRYMSVLTLMFFVSVWGGGGVVGGLNEPGKQINITLTASNAPFPFCSRVREIKLI